MKRHRKNSRIARENRLGAVTLVDIKIDNGCTTNAALCSRGRNGYCEIVEDAKSCALRAMSMVSAARERSAYAGIERRLNSEQGAPDARERTANESWRPRQADAPHLSSFDRAA